MEKNERFKEREAAEKTRAETALEVTAAVICREDGKFLLCRRPEGKSRSHLWEFPGGKLEPGETAEVCVARECREELAITVEPVKLLGEITEPYPDKTVHLRFFACRLAEGEPTALEHEALAWVTEKELPNYRLCPADAHFTEKMKTLR